MRNSYLERDYDAEFCGINEGQANVLREQEKAFLQEPKPTPYTILDIYFRSYRSFGDLGIEEDAGD